MRILTTGARGKIGRKIISQLLSESFEGDIRDYAACEKATKNIDVVIHLAAITHTNHSVAYFQVNTEGTHNLVEASEKNNVKKFIYFSSRAASSAGGAYATSKLLAEKKVMKSHLNWVIIRPSEVYGESINPPTFPRGIERRGNDLKPPFIPAFPRPRDRVFREGVRINSFLSTLAQSIKKLPVVPIIGDGQYLLSPVHVDDVVEATLKAVKLPAASKKIYTLAGPKDYTLNEVVDIISRALRVKRAKIHIPVTAMRLLISILSVLHINIIVKDQIPRLFVKKSSDISLAQKDLDYHPRSFEIGAKSILT